MPVFNQSRGRIVQIIFAVVFLVIVGQLINLQLFSVKYKLAAENNAIFRKVIIRIVELFSTVKEGPSWKTQTVMTWWSSLQKQGV